MMDLSAKDVQELLIEIVSDVRHSAVRPRPLAIAHRVLRWAEFEGLARITKRDLVGNPIEFEWVDLGNRCFGNPKQCERQPDGYCAKCHARMYP